ncbi:hypothetical protein F5146DRAFT_1079702 [Armillaria mellea]|nr:hypothetical protein F5146DRAFT_1079702 [Armillaria mellea]
MYSYNLWISYRSSFFVSYLALNRILALCLRMAHSLRKIENSSHRGMATFHLYETRPFKGRYDERKFSRTGTANILCTRT